MREFYIEKKQGYIKDYSNRYKSCKILKDIDTKEVLLETREIVDIPLNSQDIYHTVNTNEECRLDIIADTYYSNPLLWWVLAQANNIYNPLSGPLSGDVIRIPNITTLYNTNGVLL